MILLTFLVASINQTMRGERKIGDGLDNKTGSQYPGMRDQGQGQGQGQAGVHGNSGFQSHHEGDQGGGNSRSRKSSVKDGLLRRSLIVDLDLDLSF